MAEAADDWLPVDAVRPLLLDDPALVWLEHHGAAHGYAPAHSPYDFPDFLAELSARFKARWAQAMAPDAPLVCRSPDEARDRAKALETVALLRRREPVILQPALWWPPERLYGMPDAVVQARWLVERYPGLLDRLMDLPEAVYLVLKLKFAAEVEDAGQERQVLEAELLLHSFMLGHLQRAMPPAALLITRDRVMDPQLVPVPAALDGPLPPALDRLRSTFAEIRTRGDRYTPWTDPIVAANLSHADDTWQPAKKHIATARVPGGDPALLPWIGPKQKAQLAALGFPSLEALLAVDPDQVPFERCTGLGDQRRRCLRAILTAHRTGRPLPPPPSLVPRRRPFEFFVDLEYLTNLHVDFDAQWPTLEGCEMIFMVGVGWLEEEAWQFQVFIAPQETHAAEREALEAFLAFLDRRTGGAYLDPAATALYHWTAAEQWQSRAAADRHGLPPDHPLRRLPWLDLAAEVAYRAPIAVPGAWNYKLKAVARALGQLDPAYDPRWPGDLDQGKRAMVMGWKAYQAADPLTSPEMALLTDYLAADCRAVAHILRWMRRAASSAE
ncbi:MAG: hypothetical protein NZ528_06210 [Caldilineales bacterium]|nr:hypothetical protein [Caldilineales bacterium]MDW8318049.1 hypothetical protein [Anaerolineae bacterium]